MALTKRSIDALKYKAGGPSSQFLWDGSIPGFGIRVFESGAKSFVLDYWFKGRKRRYTIGPYGALTVQQAREIAVQLLAEIIKGADPLAQRRAARGASKRERDVVTVREFSSTYVERHAKLRKRSWKEDQRRLNKHVLPALGTRALASVTRADIALLHTTIGKTAQYEANRVLALIAVMYACAEEWGHLPEGFTNPATKVKPFAERKREKWVKPDELPELVGAIEAENDPHVRGALMLALYTGMRRSEILGLRWEDVDLSRSELNLPHTKANREHKVDLVPDAVEILRKLPRARGNQYVFPSPVVPGERMYDLNRPWDRVRARAWLLRNPDEACTLRERASDEVQLRGKHATKGETAITDRLLQLALAEMKRRGDVVRFHDVRRTVGSLMALDGAALQLIGKVLNHSNVDTTLVYARLVEDAPRHALEKVAERVRVARREFTQRHADRPRTKGSSDVALLPTVGSKSAQQAGTRS